MAKRKFQPGDQVVCVSQHKGIEVGSIYTVISIHYDNDVYMPPILYIEGRLHGYFASRFRLLTSIAGFYPPEIEYYEKLYGWVS